MNTPNNPAVASGTNDSYTATLLERLNEAETMIGNMCAESRPPNMSVPAGELLHKKPCGDEDIFICDAIVESQKNIIQISRIKTELTQQIEAIEKDDRFNYQPANVNVNAPLALIQVDLKARHHTLKKILAELEKLAV